MVFQDTELGSPVWTALFSDVAIAASSGGGNTTMFADDLNVFQEHPLSISSGEVVNDMQNTRTEVHPWGRRSRIIFSPSKEHIAIIHLVRGQEKTSNSSVP